MKTSFAYSTAILLGGLFLSLGGCGSSNGSSCASGQTNSQFGSCTATCGTVANGVIQPGTNNCVVNTLASGSSATCQSGYTLQAMPAPYNTSPALAASGGQACCPPGLNVSQSPQFISYCTAPMNNNYGGYGYGNTGYSGGSNYCPPNYVPNGVGGCTYI